MTGSHFRQLLFIALGAMFVSSCTQGSGADDTVGGGAAELTVVGEIHWAMPERFGLDGDGDGRMDIPNTLEYVLNLDPGSCGSGCSEVVPVFSVVLDASGLGLVTAAGLAVPIDTYEWAVPVGDEVELIASETSQTVVELPEGEYRIGLEIRGGGQLHTLETDIEVSDLLIVSIGDSFASGEGNPDVPGDSPLWADDGQQSGSPQEVAHDLAHRSSLAGPAQAALAIERADSRSSVTFVFLAASGASIDEGIVGPGRESVASNGERRALRPQLEVLSELVGCTEGSESCLREIDALFVSAGGNDIGFSFTLGSLIALDPLLVVNPIYSNLLENLAADVESNIDELPDRFDEIAAGLETLPVADVFLTAYPDSSLAAIGGRVISCESIGDDLVFGLEIDRDELDVVRERMLTPLNSALRSVAAARDWVFVDEHIESFRSHGYCGSDPYDGGRYRGSPHPDAVAAVDDPGARWFRRAEDSVSIQGGGGAFSPDRLGTTGSFHPNEFGHVAYREALLRALGSPAGSSE